ncbi:hypothetical protein ACMU_03835 [Actibacterium mucosum KCTC 23349]|uniref:diguanylate cyclase n=1 Tax=Actibacterium mucosum KCTC 23349 TaxID=1454373 RepID=A0A037ZDK9_9RHOB|nr:GGDEF domain-containing protein [Actibacterium mucosum]KAJ54227.1 hypothetical protein ACMU_03835 [Actibacterium mucosum KCTC 23349]
MQLKSKSAVVVFTATITAIAVVTVLVVDWFAYPGPAYARAAAIGVTNAVILAVPISAYVAVKMHQNWQLTERLQEALRTDPLTGLTSREAFFDHVDLHGGQLGVVMMIDIDRFKSVNDRHGHLAGDGVIQQVGNLLRAEFPAPAVLGRFGGDEFVVFIPNMPEHEGAVRAENVRLAAERSVLTAAVHSLKVTVSIGVAAKSELSDFRTALHRADGALYAAKNAGRNRVAQR